MKLNGKRVLFLAPNFFGYEQEIKLAFEKMGAKVDYFDERPKNDFFTKASIRLDLKFLIRKKINQYFDGIYNATFQNKYDYIILINPETVTEKFILDLKKVHVDVKFILYMWDSVKNKIGTIKILNYFDSAFTFDSEDAEEFQSFSFLPLFYIPIYEQIKDSNKKYKYDLCFIGTAHGDRYEVIQKIKKQADALNIKFYSFIYLPNRILFYVRKYITKQLKGANYQEFSFLPLSYKEIVNIISRSNIIIDIESVQQVGLTMRTIEMLGAEKKLITTNAQVLNYDFYEPQNIFVIDRKNPRIDKGFINKGYKKVDNNIYKNYSLNEWVCKLIEY